MAFLIRCNIIRPDIYGAKSTGDSPLVDYLNVVLLEPLAICYAHMWAPHTTVPQSSGPLYRTPIGALLLIAR